jgi:hypothetical protein
MDITAPALDLVLRMKRELLGRAGEPLHRAIVGTPSAPRKT